MNQTTKVGAMEQPWLEEQNVLEQLLRSEAELEMVEQPRQRENGVERMYPLQWKHPKVGQDPRAGWVDGRSRPMTEAELEEHFRQQISRIKHRR